MEQTPRPPATTTQRVLRSYPVRLIGTIVVVVAAITVAARMGFLVDEPTPQPSGQATAAEPREDPAQLWLVGKDIQPGVYRSAGPVDGYCMWSRHSSASGGPMEDIIASDGTSAARQMIVTIQPSDVLFRTNGCAAWERIG